jgi:hypothetical protein
MDLKSVLKRYDTKSKNTSDLTPHYVNREANLKVLAKLEARNNERKAKSKYHYTSMLDQLKTRSTSAMLENPKPYAQQLDQSSANQKMELIRMAKITANEARSDMALYDQTREEFITNYSPKINEFRMLPQIQGIFQQFSDPNYSEKGYDKNYLAQGASDKYLESIIAGRQSNILSQQLEELQRRQSTTTGAVQNLLRPLMGIRAGQAGSGSTIEDEKEEDRLSKEEMKRLQAQKVQAIKERRIQEEMDALENRGDDLDDAGRIEIERQAEEEAKQAVKEQEKEELKQSILELNRLDDDLFLTHIEALPVNRPMTKYEDYLLSSYNKVVSSAPTNVAEVKKIMTRLKIKQPKKPLPTATQAERDTYLNLVTRIDRRLTVEMAMARYKKAKKIDD